MATETDSLMTEALALLDRARFDIERGWYAAAHDALTRATNRLRKDHAI